jgi:hypothetical protein
MHSMLARRIKADCADMIQALDQTGNRGRLRRFRHLQPGEPALVGFRPTLRQHIQPTTLDLVAGLIAGLDAESIEPAG